MFMKIIRLLLSLLACFAVDMAQTQDTVQIDTATTDSTTYIAADTDTAVDTNATVVDTTTGDTLALPRMPSPEEEKKTEKIHIVRRNFKYRRQIGTALAMMAFLAIVLTTVQSWNPD